MTGARTGCGVLVYYRNHPSASGRAIELDKAPGFQWYGKIATIWDVPQKVLDKYGAEYYVQADRQAADILFPGGASDEK
jgi:hypothetical protein